MPISLHIGRYTGIPIWFYLSGLSEARSSQEKEQIVDELYRRCDEQISKNPEDYNWDLVNAYIVIRKKEFY